MAILEIQSLEKIYTARFGSNQVHALTDVSFSVEQGEYVAIMGESGSGKSTLLNILAALDKPTKGDVFLEGKPLIFLPLVLSGKNYRDMISRLRPIAPKLGIEEILLKYPYEVSGGQKQRAAIARAIITNPKLILADEPTGALDSRSSDSVLKIFSDINKDGQTILMVTHSTKAASHAGRVLFIKDGEVFHQIYRGNSSNEEMYQKISDTLTLLATGGDNNA